MTVFGPPGGPPPLDIRRKKKSQRALRNISNNQRSISKSSGSCQVVTAKTPKQERKSRALDNKADIVKGAIGSSSVVFDVSFDNTTDGKGLSSPPIKKRLEAEARKTQALIVDEETRLKNIRQKQELVRLRKDSLLSKSKAANHNAHVSKVCIGRAVKQKQEKKNAKHEMDTRMRQAAERRQLIIKQNQVKAEQAEQKRASVSANKESNILNKAFSEDVQEQRLGSLFFPIVKKNRSKSIQFRSPSVAEFNDTSPPSHVLRLPRGVPRIIDVELHGREDESSCSSILSNWLASAQSRIAARSDTSRQREDFAESRRRRREQRSIIRQELTGRSSPTAVQDKQSPESKQQDAIQTCNEDVEQTRAMISKVISKPKCSDKLLNKPPFRFIHDLIMGIGKATEFDLGMIFSEDELTSSNVKGKQPKLQFLGKLINFLEVNLDTSMDDVKPAKIVSGLEPERTRYLLQLFTVVVTTKSDTIVDTSATSKSIKERAESLEGHLISKFAISESNRHAVPAWKQNKLSRDAELLEAQKKLSENSSCERYIRMVEIGVNIDAVAYGMRRDGVDPDVIEAFTKLYKQGHTSGIKPSNSLVLGTLETSKSSLTYESDASELDKLFDIGDWKSILAAAKDLAESDSEQLDKFIEAGDWKGIVAAAQRAEQLAVDDDSSSQQSPVLLRGEEIISISSSSETDANLDSPISLISNSEGDASADLGMEIRREVEAKNWYRVGELAAILLCKDRPAVPTLRPDISLCESDINDLIGKGDWDRVMLIAANLVFRRESFFPSDEDVCCQLIGKWMNDADDTLEEREVQAYLETVLLPIVTRSRSKDRTPATPPRLTVLISKGVYDLKQSRDQLQALDLLSELSIPYTIVDGMDASQKEKRDDFFETSGIRGNYPQIFTSASSDACFYLGGLEWLRNAHKTGELNFLR